MNQNALNSKALKKLATGALEELKAKNIISINVQSVSNVTDTMVIASGTSLRHIQALADNVVKSAKMKGIIPLGVEGKQNTEWVLVDLGDVVVHIMTSASRQFYNLERLWEIPEMTSCKTLEISPQ